MQRYEIYNYANIFYCILRLELGNIKVNNIKWNVQKFA